MMITEEEAAKLEGYDNGIYGVWKPDTITGAIRFVPETKKDAKRYRKGNALWGVVYFPLSFYKNGDVNDGFIGE